MNSLVSIIVPCYNQAQYLPETLDSVLSQTYQNWECIIVNDGSPDNTEEIAQKYSVKDNRFKYLFKENGGLASARNFGIRNSSGEFILPLDSDDFIGSDYLELALIHFEKFPNTKLVYCKAELFEEKKGEWILPQYNYIRLLFHNIIFCSAIFKRIDYDNTVIGYRETLQNGLEDWDFWISLLEEKDIVYQIPKILFYYRIRKDSMIRKVTSEQDFEIKSIIFNYHRIKYDKFIPTLIWSNPLNYDLQIYIKRIENDKENILKSNSYKLGRNIIKPFKYILRSLKKL